MNVVQMRVFFFFQNKYREAYDKKVKGLPYAISSDTPELIRIKKAQEQLSEVLYGSEALIRILRHVLLKQIPPCVQYSLPDIHNNMSLKPTTYLILQHAFNQSLLCRAGLYLESYISFAFQVKYRMEGAKAKTMCNYDGEAREIAHVKNVTDLISKVSFYYFLNSCLNHPKMLAADKIL